MAASKYRVPRSRERLLYDCESHLKFLEEALTAQTEDPYRYKQIAGELRVLVCKSGRNRPLLLDLMYGLGFDYHVPSDPRWGAPFRTAFKIDPSGEGKQPASLREIIECGQAAYIGPEEWTYGELILAVAQQMGGAHEDATVDEGLMLLEQYIDRGYSGIGAALRDIGFLVLDAGKRFILYAVKHYGFQPHYF
jgi:hypothetical protein